MLRPLVPVSPGIRVSLGVAFFVVFFAAWAAATLGGFVNRTFLADPFTMLRAGWRLLVVHGFYQDIGVTIWRVFGGFVLAAAIGVPLGIVWAPTRASKRSSSRSSPSRVICRRRGSFRCSSCGGDRRDGKAPPHLHRVVLPARADVAVTVGATRRDLVEAAYTPGRAPAASCVACCCRRARPNIAESLRLVLGWAWTYVIVAELIGASSGIGHMITDSQALLDTGQIIFGIVVIGVIGLISDYLFKTLNQRLFPWSLA